MYINVIKLFHSKRGEIYEETYYDCKINCYLLNPIVISCSIDLLEGNSVYEPL